jgi:hypothetical protein
MNPFFTAEGAEEQRDAEDCGRAKTTKGLLPIEWVIFENNLRRSRGETAGVQRRTAAPWRSG